MQMRREINYFRLAVQSEPFLVVYEYRILLKIGRSSLEGTHKDISKHIPFHLPGIFCSSLEEAQNKKNDED